MSNLPDGHFLEIELTAGVWTDITAYIDPAAGGTIQFGRSTQYGPPNAATLTITLDNTDGRFTPLRQTLVDGTTAHPYYPNLVPRKRIRLGYIKTAVRYTRFTGYVRGWPPSLLDGEVERVTVSAVDRSLQLQRVTMLQPVAQEIDYLINRTGFSTSFPVYYWPLTDAAGSTTAATPYAGGVPLTQVAALPTFGVNGASVGNGTAALFAGTVGAGSGLSGFPIGWTSGITVFAWVKPTLGGVTMSAVSLDDADDIISFELRINAAGKAEIRYGSGAPTILTAPNAVSGWQLIGARFNGTTFTLWVNGALVATSGAITAQQKYTTLRVGQPVFAGSSPFDGSIGHVFVSNWGTSLTATDIARIYNVGGDGLGETVDTRISRFLRYANLAPADINADVSTVTLSTFDQSGKTPFDAGQELIDSEGGGAALYVDPTDVVLFKNRNTLYPAAPVLTLDAEADLDGGTWDTAYDADNLVNSSVGSRSTISGVAATLVDVDATSFATFGPAAGDFTSYSVSSDDVLYNAQSRVAAGRTPGFRLNKVTVDLWTAQNNLYAAVAAVRIGSRIRVANIPVGGAPATQLDLVVQGWTDTFSLDGGWTVAFDTIPADNPPWMVWDNATYGRWQDAGGVLNATITNSGTTLIIATAGSTNPAFTTNVGSYPMTIQIGAEHITLTSAPGGATSPQTFTGVTRGADGTTAAVQTLGSTVQLVPASGWTL